MAISILMLILAALNGATAAMSYRRGSFRFACAFSFLAGAELALSFALALA